MHAKLCVTGQELTFRSARFATSGLIGLGLSRSIDIETDGSGSSSLKIVRTRQRDCFLPLMDGQDSEEKCFRCGWLVARD